LKLKHIYEEVKDGKPVDSQHLRAEIEDVMDEIRRSAEQSRIEDIDGDEKHHQLYDAEILKEIALHLPEDGKDLTNKQRKDIQKACEDIARDLTFDDLLEINKVTRKDLEKEQAIIDKNEK